MKTSTLIILAVVVVLIAYSPGGQSILTPTTVKPPGATPGAGATRLPIVVPNPSTPSSPHPDFYAGSAYNPFAPYDPNRPCPTTGMCPK